MMACNQQNIFLYDQLTDAEKRAVDMHVATCVACLQLFEQGNAARAVVESAARYRPAPVNAARLTHSIMTAVTRETLAPRSWVASALDQVYLRYGMAACSVGLLLLFLVEQQYPTVFPNESPGVGKTVALASPSWQQLKNQRKQRSISYYACAQSAGCNQSLIASFKSK